MFLVNRDDPLSTATATLALASEVRPALEDGLLVHTGQAGGPISATDIAGIRQTMPLRPRALEGERNRRFNRALHAVSALCPGRDRRVSDYKAVLSIRIDPLVIEHARWLLVSMSLARGTAGGPAMTALLRRGYMVTSEHGRWRQPGAILPLDAPGLLYLGHVLPSRQVPWKCLEQVALAADPSLLPERRWCSAHETLHIVARLQDDGHHVDMTAPDPW